QSGRNILLRDIPITTTSADVYFDLLVLPLALLLLYSCGQSGRNILLRDIPITTTSADVYFDLLVLPLARVVCGAVLLRTEWTQYPAEGHYDNYYICERLN
ncbi:hypothetical protein J6590_040642, partial [Homalodisca vitripennis]